MSYSDIKEEETSIKKLHISTKSCYQLSLFQRAKDEEFPERGHAWFHNVIDQRAESLALSVTEAFGKVLRWEDSSKQCCHREGIE